MPTKRPSIYDFDAIKNAIAADQPAPTGDERILALFEEWRIAARAERAAYDGDREEEAEAVGARKIAIQTAIETTPASGATGLAVTTFLLIMGDLDGETLLSTELEASHIGYEGAEEWGGILRNLIRFAPVLEPLCRQCLADLEAEIAEKAAEAQP